MALFNYAAREITLKIVYYGPGLSGKTTNIQHIHSRVDPSKKGRLLSLNTEADRTLFFDFLPVELGKINDFYIRFQLYTVPGQVMYNATRRLVLKGADAVVFVADSQREALEDNVDSLRNMKDNLIANNIDPGDIPLIMQYNKRDLAGILTVEDLNSRLNPSELPYYEAVAIEGRGVLETLDGIVKLLLRHMSVKHDIDLKASSDISGLIAEPEEEHHEPVRSFDPFEAVEAASPATVHPDRTVAVSETGEGITVLLEVLSLKLSRIEEHVKKAVSSPEGREEIEKILAEYANSLRVLSRALSESKGKQDEIIRLLRDIKGSIDNAKTKRRWLLFG